MQQRRVVTEKEKRILAYHEAGHALMSHLIGERQPVQKVTIVSRGQALGYTLNIPSEDRYLHTKEELVDMMKVYLAGRAAEHVVFGASRTARPTTSSASPGSPARWCSSTAWATGSASRTMRADNYALSEETKRVRDQEQARLTDDAYQEAVRLLQKHRASLDRVAHALLEKETLDRAELEELLRRRRARVARLRDRRDAARRRLPKAAASAARRSERSSPQGLHAVTS